jgi:hypothetical protein
MMNFVNEFTVHAFYLQCLQEKLKREKGETPSDLPKKKEETITLRPLSMTDLKEAKNQVDPCLTKRNLKRCGCRLTLFNLKNKLMAVRML